MHPYLTQAVAAERDADFRRAAAANRRARLAVATRTGTRHSAGKAVAATHRPAGSQAGSQAAAGAACTSSVSRAA